MAKICPARTEVECQQVDSHTEQMNMWLTGSSTIFQQDSKQRYTSLEHTLFFMRAYIYFVCFVTQYF